MYDVIGKLLNSFHRRTRQFDRIQWAKKTTQLLTCPIKGRARPCQGLIMVTSPEYTWHMGLPSKLMMTPSEFIS